MENADRRKLADGRWLVRINGCWFLGHYRDADKTIEPGVTADFAKLQGGSGCPNSGLRKRQERQRKGNTVCMKVVINRCYGGFSLSAAGTKEFYKRKGKKCYFFAGMGREPYRKATERDLAGMFWHCFDIPNPNRKASDRHYLTNRPDDRCDPDLIATVEKLGEKANGQCAELEIVEIPDGVDYNIADYDGMESIHESHRSWR